MPYRPQIHIVDYDGGLHTRDRDRNSGSCIMLASDNGGGPRSRWQLMVDPDDRSGPWTMITTSLLDI